MRTAALCIAIGLICVLSCDVHREPEEIKTEKKPLENSELLLEIVPLLAACLKSSRTYIPHQVDLLWPPEGQTKVVQPLDLTWKPVPRAVGYQIQVAGEVSLADPTIDVVTEKTALYLKGSGGPLFWRVRAKAEGGEGPWSEVRSFKFGP